MLKKKYILNVVLLLLLIVAAKPHATCQVYKYSEINIPASQGLFSSFYVNEYNQVFLPLNGGIYLPKDSLWFLPPAKGYYFTSFAPNLQDTAFFAMANTADSSELFYLKSSVSAPIKRFSVLKLKKGIYNLIYKNKLCYIWGYSANNSRIGILGNGEVQWILNVNGMVRQIQVDDAAQVYFLLGRSVYKLNSREALLTLDRKIYGFAIDREGRVLVSCADGIGIKDNDKLSIIATGMAGLLENRNDRIFVLSQKSDKLYTVFK